MNKYVALLAIGFSSVSLVQAKSLPSFQEVDTNHDGVISPTEAAAVEGLDFSTADANQDGMIDQKEYQALSQK